MPIGWSGRRSTTSSDSAILPRTGISELSPAPRPPPGQPEEMLSPVTWDFGADSRWDLARRLFRAFALVDAQRLDEAAAVYQRCGVPEGWEVAPMFRLVGLAVGAQVAAALGLADDTQELRERLTPYRGQYVVGGAGGPTSSVPSSSRSASARRRWPTGIPRGSSSPQRVHCAGRSARRASRSRPTASSRPHWRKPATARQPPGSRSARSHSQVPSA